MNDAPNTTDFTRLRLDFAWKKQKVVIEIRTDAHTILPRKGHITTDVRTRSLPREASREHWSAAQLSLRPHVPTFQIKTLQSVLLLRRFSNQALLVIAILLFSVPDDTTVGFNVIPSS